MSAPDNLAPDHKPFYLRLWFKTPTMSGYEPVIKAYGLHKDLPKDMNNATFRVYGDYAAMEVFPTEALHYLMAGVPDYVQQRGLYVIRSLAGNDDATSNPLYEDQRPQPADSHLRRCCADLCDPEKVAELWARIARQESNPAPDTDAPHELQEDCTNLSYEQVIDLAVEIELRQDSLKGPMSRGELICCLLRTLGGVGVRIW